MAKNTQIDLINIANHQRGYFTARQAEECGYSRSNFHRFIQSGEWEREVRGIYRFTWYPILERPELVLWTLWSQNIQGVPQGVMSHETALDIHDISDVIPPKMHMTVPTTFRRRSKIPGHIVLHYHDLNPQEIETRSAYSVTNPLRTLIDIVKDQGISLEQVVLGIQQAFEQGLITKRDMQQNEEAHILKRIIYKYKLWM